MFGKVFKNEFVHVRGPLGVTLGFTLLAAGVLYGLSFLFSSDWALALLIFSGLAIGVGFLISNILLLMNYYQSLHGRRAYLTMTLPVKGRTLFFAHTVMNCLLATLAMIIAFLGWTGLAVTQYYRTYGVYPHLPSLSAILNSAPAWMWIWLLLVAVLSIIESIVFYESILTIGNRPWFARMGKFAGPAVAGIIIYAITQVFTMLVLFLTPIMLRVGGNPDVGFTYEWVFESPWHAQAQSLPVVQMLIPALVVGAVLWWLSARSLERRVSLR